MLEPIGHISIDHINIVVDDLERMKAFYCDILGMTVSKEATISGEWIEKIVGLKNVVADVCYLDLHQGPRIELIKYHSPNGTRPVALSDPNTKGLRHVALRVEDLDKATTALKRAGVRFFGEVQAVPDSQVSYAGGVQKRLAYFHDPEGNLLELCCYA
jgi:catechol 2,3-dioxygenase-like lactoylglutathione lyase family enzyme